MVQNYFKSTHSSEISISLVDKNNKPLSSETKELIYVNADNGKLEVNGKHFKSEQSVLLRAINSCGRPVTKIVEINKIPKLQKREVVKREGMMKYSTVVTERTLNEYQLSNCCRHSANLKFNIIVCDDSRIIL